MNYNELSKAAHKNAVKHGWWEKRLSNEHSLMLVITEVSEAVEAGRGRRTADVAAFSAMGNRQIAFEHFIKDTKEDKMADIAIRLFDLAGALGVDFDKMNPCRYHRAFPHFSFTENAFALCKGLGRDVIAVEKRILFGLDFVFGWAKAMRIDLPFFIREKMRYNTTRPYKHGKEY